MAKTAAAERAKQVLEERNDLINNTSRAMREVRRQRRSIINFMTYVRGFQTSLDAAPGIHVRKEFILEFLTGAADHFTMEKI